MKFILFNNKTYLFTVFFLSIALYFNAQIVDPNQNILDPDMDEYLLPDPFEYDVFYDSESGNYLIYKRIGNVQVGTPIIMNPEEYAAFNLRNSMDDYYRDKSNQVVNAEREKEDDKDKALLPEINVDNKIFNAVFGGNKIELVPTGYVSFDLGILSQKIDNPQLLPQNRKNFTIDIQQRIQMSVLGKVGNNLKLQANYDTQSGFAFENKLNLAWRPPSFDPSLPKGVQGENDNIIKNIEFGNVNFPLSTNLIQGPQALEGIKTELQFGRTYLTGVFSNQQSESRNIAVQGGGLVSTFKVSALDYEENQHYFLGHFFRNHYDEALQNYPFINTNINITRLEVWKIDRGNGNLQEQRNLLAIRDLGEDTNNPNALPDNDLNNIYNAIDALPGINNPQTAFEAINNQALPNWQGGTEVYNSSENFAYTTKAKLLTPSEYKFFPQLGYISLTSRIQDDQLLAVSFEYTVNGSTETHRVGTFSTESTEVLKVKLLKHNASFSVSSPMWDLMMKNIYNLEGSEISRDNFFLNVTYKEPGNGTLTYLPDPAVSNGQMIKIVNWDRLNLNGDSTDGQGDGVFDFVPGLTIDPQQGRVFFTQVEPFGEHLESIGVNQELVFSDLYDKQKAEALSSPLATRYNLEGRFQGSVGTGISLGAINVPRGSVKVTANGQELIEGVDYTVDYTLGRVQIINQALKDSGVPINISLENQNAFNLQRKRFIGLNAVHTFSEKMQLGFTAVNYKERPQTQKVQYGVEPVNNTVLGTNFRLNQSAPFLTRFADMLPLVKTNAPSNISFMAEGAYLIPGTNNAVQNQSYIDDFEEATSRISLKDPELWMLASTPNSTDITPFGLETGQASGYLRAQTSWYTIDPRFYGVQGNAPDGIDNNSLSENMVRRVRTEEIFTNKDFVAGQQIYMNTFDFTVYPQYKGPYNNDTTPIFSQNTTEMEQRWGGIMRNINVTNFTQTNIDQMEFWVMDPYADLDITENLGSDPKLYIQLGNISEDVVRDGKQLYENGLPSINLDNPTVQTMDWGIVPNNSPVLYTFDTEGAERREQDAGFDGILSSAFNVVNPFALTEDSVYGNNLTNNPIAEIIGREDPALDDFIFYYDEQWGSSPADAGDIRQRYRYFRNPEGNSPSGSLNASSAVPDAEDTNKDYSLDLAENYNQYSLSLSRNDLENNTSGYIVDQKSVDVELENGSTTTTKWYLFRIPLKEYDNGGSDDVLNNVRFMRMLVNGVNKTTTLRFGTFDLLRTDWRKYDKNIYPLDYTTIGEGNEAIDVSNFELGSVDIVSNSEGTPPYMLPPGIVREEIGGTSGLVSQNEASLYMKVLKLQNEDARGVFKNTQMDMRRYKSMKFFVHAENIENTNDNSIDQDAKFFIRLGSDLNENYYEYEFSMQYTPNTATGLYEIWPNNNNIEFPTDWFVEAKNQRDAISTSNIDYRYEAFNTGDPNRKIIVKGRPSLGTISTIMIGVRNTSTTDTKSMIIWVDEIRLSGIENEGGYAANASINFNLGDFATINASGNMKTIGYGAIDAGPSLRNQEEQKQYAVSANVNVDKFLPEKWGVKIPFQYSTSESFEDPKFDPIDNDVEIKDSPRKEEIQDIARTYTQNQTFAVTNMRKEKTNGKKAKFYDISNLNTSFLYANQYYRDTYTQYNLKQDLRASIDYNYSFRSNGVEPFKNLAAVQDTAKSAQYLQWLKEFNFNLVPSRLNFKTEVLRSYNEFQFRDINSIILGSPNYFPVSSANRFVMGWQYNLGFNLAKSLKLDINSSTTTLVDDIGTNNPDDKLIWSDIARVGRPINYNQNISLNYRVPFQYFPYIDFLSAEVGYTGGYNWVANSTALDIDGDLGNIAQNNNSKSAIGSVDFNNLYNKFKGYKKYDSIRIARNREVDSLTRAYESQSAKKKRKKFKSYTFKHKYRAGDYVWGFFSMFKQLQVNYSENNSTALPGVLYEPNFWGYGDIENGFRAPTYGFLFGSQRDLRQRAFNQQWLTGSNALFQPYLNVESQDFSMTTKIEPMKNLVVDLNWNKLNQLNINQVGYNLNPEAFQNETASYNMSIITANTSFTDPDRLYEDLLSNAQIVSARVAAVNGSPQIDADNDGYIDGYGLTNAEVLIPSFYSAYTGKSPSSTKLGYKKGFPLPNWRIVYTGLKNIPFINYWTQNIELSHGYVSNYQVNGIQSSLEYYDNPNGFDLNNNYLNYYYYNTVSLRESFSPLIGVNFIFRNDMQISAQYNKDRISILSLNNYTLQEDLSNEMVFGFSYIIKNLVLKIRYRGNTKKMESPLNIRADVSIRDTKTSIRRLIEQDLQITGGQKFTSIRFTADYNFGNNLNLALFYDQQVSSYKISTAYPLSITRAGLRVTFNFGR